MITVVSNSAPIIARAKGTNGSMYVTGLKANVSEADHPLLCEGTRRQRGDLAIAMLVHYKDDQLKLSKVSLAHYMYFRP